MAYTIKKYFKNSDNFLKLLQTKNEVFWLKRGEVQVVKSFNDTLKSIKTYSRFLKENNVSVKKIKKSNDLLNLPVTDKNNYLRKYEFESLVIGGFFPRGGWVVSATSGSTGEPFYFPRTETQDLYYALTAELYLRTNFKIHNKKTLYVNGFALGIWIGGLFTYQAIKHIIEKNKYDLTIVNPGINKEEMLKVIKKLSPYYDQVIIGGYPPLIKDFIDFSNDQGFDWSRVSKKFIFSAEGFSEEFRDYIAKHTNLKNIYKDTLNHYGTVDLGTMSYETPLSILVRRLALENKNFFNALFGEGSRLPTLTQFIPEQFYFEELNGKLFCTSESGIPLIRYDLKDLGGVKKFSEVFKIAKEFGIDLEKEIDKSGIKDTVWELPFVYVVERADFSISLYGANVYPENIRPVLLHDDFNQHLSGRFYIQVEHLENQDPRFNVHVELKKNVNIDNVSKENLEISILKNLLKENSEYSIIYQSMGKKVFPNIVMWGYEDHVNFKRGGKQKWVIK
jgi:phenylacetate-CoA ligase